MEVQRNPLLASTALNSWTPLKDHDIQIKAWRNTKRFSITPAGRRSGKTEIIGKRKMAIRFMLCHDKKYPQFYSPYPDPKFFIGAPTRDQVKMIYWQDMKKLIPRAFMSRDPNESNLILYGLNGAELRLVGLDKPERMEGSPWDHGVIDEIGNVKKNAWQANIRPALSDRNGGCDFIGVPEGRNHYYDMWRRAGSDKTGQWARFHWISADILPAHEIESAKAELDELVYLQEYEASFVNFSGLAYYNFDERYNVGNVTQFYNPNKPLVFCFDFNVSPGIAVIAQEFGADVFQIPIGQTVTAAIGEVHIPRNSTTPRVCQKLIQDWGEHQGKIICYGDATGGAKGSAKVRGSDWDLIKAELYGHYGRKLGFNVPKSNPQERQRVNAMNCRLKSVNHNIRLMVDGKHCSNLIRDFEGVTLIEGGAGEIDKTADKALTHLTDGLGYYIHREYPVFKYWGEDDINEALKDLQAA